MAYLPAFTIKKINQTKGKYTSPMVMVYLPRFSIKDQPFKYRYTYKSPMDLPTFTIKINQIYRLNIPFFRGSVMGKDKPPRFLGPKNRGVASLTLPRYGRQCVELSSNLWIIEKSFGKSCFVESWRIFFWHFVASWFMIIIYITYSAFCKCDI